MHQPGAICPASPRPSAGVTRCCHCRLISFLFLLLLLLLLLSEPVKSPINIATNIAKYNRFKVAGVPTKTNKYIFCINNLIILIYDHTLKCASLCNDHVDGYLNATNCAEPRASNYRHHCWTVSTSGPSSCCPADSQPPDTASVCLRTLGCCLMLLPV